MAEETEKIPTKEELITAMREQIDVKSVQLELQEINERLAKSKAGELQALQFIAQMTDPQPLREDLEDHTLSQEDLDRNPDLVKAGFKVGDEVQVPKQSDRKLKKN